MTEQSMAVGWRRSTRCGGGACVEVATDGNTILTRDAKAPLDPSLAFTRSAWIDFMGDIKAGKLG
ncbi:MAG TPA: DUF397 domain-containing protein [Asanoa sp.]